MKIFFAKKIEKYNKQESNAECSCSSKKSGFFRGCNLRRTMALLIVLSFIIMLVSGCGDAKSTNTTTITIWHVYGEQSDSPLNDMIEEFNNTVGIQKGITVKSMKVSDTNTIHEAVLKSEQGGPGTEKLPDIFVSYPKTVLAMSDNEKLVDFQDYFSEEELSSFRQDFIEEGMIDGRLLILPVAKSTEVLFVNKTIFDKFANENGVSLDDLSTWEGLLEVARKYTSATGKSFLADDYFFNYFQLGQASYGGKFISESGLNMDSQFDKLWKPMGDAAVEGAIWLGSGYASEALRTGDAVASIASSAGILYYSDMVTYEDNTTDELELVTLPIPTYSGGEKLAMNRGAGMCLLKSDEQRENAAMTFLKWLTSPQNNVNFVTQAGYMPVTNEAFENYLPDAIGTLDSPRYKSLYNTFMEMQKEYSFYTPPQYDFYLDKETWFEKNVRQILAEKAADYKERMGELVDSATSTDASGSRKQNNSIEKQSDVEKEKLRDSLVNDALESLKEIN